MAELTHFDAAGNAHMVDVGAKAETKRLARAVGKIRMKPETFALVASGTAKKGDVIGVARIALTHVTVDFELCRETSVVLCSAVCETKGQTGVEMEALTAVEVGLLTVYDMLKAVDRFMEIGGIHLEEKAGGKSGHWVAADTKATFED